MNIKALMFALFIYAPLSFTHDMYTRQQSQPLSFNEALSHFEHLYDYGNSVDTDTAELIRKTCETIAQQTAKHPELHNQIFMQELKNFIANVLAHRWVDSIPAKSTEGIAETMMSIMAQRAHKTDWGKCTLHDLPRGFLKDIYASKINGKATKIRSLAQIIPPLLRRIAK